MNRSTIFFVIASLTAAVSLPNLAFADDVWNQWRGPNRDGKVGGSTWPDEISKGRLQKLWSVPLGPSYSGPIIVGDRIFVTETENKQNEVVRALDRKTGKEIWSTKWKGAMTVPFFAKSNGSWIRSTPAYDDGKLYVAGMRDVLVCLDASDGKEIWKIDFPNQMQTKNPDFGFVCSPLVHKDHVYVQAGQGFCKIEKKTGKVVWRVLQDGGGTFGSAFSSPYIATLYNQQQILVQTRNDLCGVDIESGKVFWKQTVPNFRGMNILTPTVFKNSVFTSSYQKGSYLYEIKDVDNSYQSKLAWQSKSRGYMSSPIIIDGHAYLHLQNQIFTCIDLKTGQEKWKSKRFGKYASLVAQGKKILALTERGELLLIRANPEKFDLADKVKVSDQETWAHLAVCGDQVFVRELKGVTAFQWDMDSKK
jgi:hypothetical protein